MDYESATPTPYAVRCRETFDVGKPPCNGGAVIYLPLESYDAQMCMPDARWKCPRCGGSAEWDDDTYENFYFPEAADVDEAKDV